jgi:hypothetical protein
MGTGTSSHPALAQFPRTAQLTSQSPKYWAKEKDRYLRQLLILDIEDLTKRPLFVYFSQLDQEINHSDPDDIAEIIQAIDADECDIMIQTPGGSVDACEKIISVLQKKFKKYRVIVPSWAKSCGTVIALSSSEIVLGINSELGPIDPHMRLNPATPPIPCQILANDPGLPFHLAAKRMKQMATDILDKGMMHGKDKAEIDAVIAKISDTAGYMSHGAVIDFEEAKSLGLSAAYLSPDDELWRKIWLLYCMYDYDTKIKNLGKIFEGNKFSIARPK